MSFMSANTVVRKVFYHDEMGLHRAIEDNAVYGNTVFKLDHVIPIDETSAYLIFSPDPDKVIVQFLHEIVADDKDTTTEVFSMAPNGDLVVMSLAEVELLRTQDVIEIGGELCQIDKITMRFNDQAERSLIVYLENPNN